jgi:hypothetical protein
MVHIFDGRRAVCGYTPSREMGIQFCSHGVREEWIACPLCLKKFRRHQEKETKANDKKHGFTESYTMFQWSTDDKEKTIIRVSKMIFNAEEARTLLKELSHLLKI